MNLSQICDPLLVCCEYELPAIILTPATAAAPATIAATAAASFWTSFIDGQVASVHFVAVQRVDGSIALGVIAHFDEAKTFGLPCVTVGYDTDAIDLTIRLE